MPTQGLPLLTAPAASERYGHAHGRPHKKLTGWGRRLVSQARRWLPERALALVSDSSFAALEFLAALCRHNVTCVTRLRLDAALYAPAPPRRPGTKGRPRQPARVWQIRPRCSPAPPQPGSVSSSPDGGARPGAASTSCLRRCRGAPWGDAGWADPPGAGARSAGSVRAAGVPRAALGRSPEQVLRWFVRRWQLGAAFEGTRAHLVPKPGGTGPAAPLRAPRPARSACSPSSPRSRHGPEHPSGEPSQTAPGVAKAAPPSAARSPSSVVISGGNRVHWWPGTATTRQNRNRRCGMPPSTHFATQPDSQSRGYVPLQIVTVNQEI